MTAAAEARRGHDLARELLELVQSRAMALSPSDLRAIAEGLDALSMRARECAEALERISSRRAGAD